MDMTRIEKVIEDMRKMNLEQFLVDVYKRQAQESQRELAHS